MPTVTFCESIHIFLQIVTFSEVVESRAHCEPKNLPSISVNKGHCSHKPLHSSINVKPGETLDEIRMPTIESLVTTAATIVAQTTDLRQKEELLVLVKLIKGIISRSPDSCIFP